VNGTGVYSLLLHNTLFHGESLYEPVQVEAKFSTILPDTISPVIKLTVPKFVGTNGVKVPVVIEDDNPAGWTYTVDGGEPRRIGAAEVSKDASSSAFEIDLDTLDLAEGTHTLRIDSADAVGHASSAISSFDVDRSPPSIELFVEPDGLGRQTAEEMIIISRDATLAWDIRDRSGVTSPVAASLAGAALQQLEPSSATLLNTTHLADGIHQFSISAEDAAGNMANRTVSVLVDKTQPSATLASPGSLELSGPVKLAVGAADANLKQVMLMVGDRMTVNVTGMTEYTLDTTELPDGTHSLTLVATDIAGNEGVATSSIAVSNVAPQLMSSAIMGLLAGGAIASGAWLMILRGRRRQSSSPA
jgi:hypothetical protein